MIKLVVCAKKHPQLSVDEFHRHWRTTHADLFRRNPVCLKFIRRYVQSHTTPSDYAAGPVPYDGIAELWFDSAIDRDAFFQHPEYKRKIALDEPAFTDIRNSKWFYTTEEVIIG